LGFHTPPFLPPVITTAHRLFQLMMLWDFVAHPPDFVHRDPIPSRHAPRLPLPHEVEQAVFDTGLNYAPIPLVHKMIDTQHSRRLPDEGCPAVALPRAPAATMAATAARGSRSTLRRTTLGRCATSLMHCSALITFVIVALFAVAPVSAVQIPFRNCLDESYRRHDPPRLQWVPLYAEAVFDREHKSHHLFVRVYGNVTGSQNTDEELPPPDDPYWQGNDTNGKIILNEPNQLATTLFQKVSVLTYQSFSNKTSFCDALSNGKCPLPPVFDTTGLYATPFPIAPSLSWR
jgi:hypothetical protein